MLEKYIASEEEKKYLGEKSAAVGLSISFAKALAKTNFTVEQLSNISGVDVKIISGLLRAENNPTLSDLSKLAYALNVSLMMV